MTDIRVGKSIGTSNASDIKCANYNMRAKVLNAEIYPEVGDEVKYYNSSLGFYQWAKVVKYKSKVAIIIEDIFDRKQYTYTLRKDGKWIVVRDKGLYNVFDIKYMYGLKDPDKD